MTLLGKVIRIDVSGASAAQPYVVPSDNPFVELDGALPEIWALGLRNPWRMAFDPETGALWVGDVGQGQVEEISVVSGGRNYGWDIMEGDICHEPSNGCGHCGIDLPEGDVQPHERALLGDGRGGISRVAGAGTGGRIRLRRLLQRRGVGDARGRVGVADRGGKWPG